MSIHYLHGNPSLEPAGASGPTDEALESLFRDLDADGGGTLCRDEMDSAFQKMFGDDADPSIVNEYMAATDTNNDGEIDLAEFKIIMRAGSTKLRGASIMLTDPDAMRLMRRIAREELEGVELTVRLRGEDIEPGARREFVSQRRKLEERIATLNGFLAAAESAKTEEEVDLAAAAAAAAEVEAKRKREGDCGEKTKLGVTILKNTISGVLTIYLYFADLTSDYQVTMRYYVATTTRALLPILIAS